LRRVALVALTFFGIAPAAQAGCGMVTSAVSGKAPLAVTFTASCASASYTWDFGDGQSAVGQTVQHTFAAGYWHPALTSDAGLEAAPPVTAITLRVHAPRRADYGAYVALEASVVPRIPVTYRGRPFVHGKLRVRVLRAAPWIVRAGPVSASAATTVVPKLVIALRGTPVVGGSVRVVATLHPAAAGTVVAPSRLDTGSEHVAHVIATTRPATGWAKVTEKLAVPVRSEIRTLEQRLADLHYAIRVDGRIGAEDVEAIYAFQKVEGLPRTGAVTPSLVRRVFAAHTPAARYPGDHIEIDKGRQVLFVVRGGEVTLVVATSTGATGNTPLGVWHVYRKVTGFDWVLYYPSYFLRGFAVHGYPDVPPYPASHGCARIPMWIAQTVYAQIPYGSTVYVYQ
jgi:lipoprotein-anchoring transpeptidase ErfK/SrfK